MVRESITCILLTIVALAGAETYKQNLDCLPGLDDCTEDYGKFDPPATGYIQKRLGPGAAVGILCIVVCCLVWWCWCCCRCWARCCSCCRMSLCQCCCGAGTPEEEMVYTRCQRMTLAVLILIAFLILCVGGVLGYLGGNKTYDGGVDLMSQAITAVEEMESLNSDVAKVAFTSLGNFYSATSGGSVTYDDAAVTEAISKVKKYINDAKKALTDGQDIIHYALPAFYGFCAAVSLLGFLSWCCGNGTCSMIMGMMSSVMLFFTWLLFAVFWVTGAFLDDTCVALSEHYALDCMKEPGKTCTRAKLTDFFQCPDVTTVSEYYQQAYNLLDTNNGNGAGQNQYGNVQQLINGAYATTTEIGSASVKAPAAVSAGGQNPWNSLAMQPWTTCASGETFNALDASSAGAAQTWTTPLVGPRSTTCRSGATNTGQVAPQNTPQTVNGVQTNGLVAQTGSVNPPWATSTDTGRTTGDSIGSCERACLNSSATAKTDGTACTTPGSTCILDSLTNYGGNAMFRKFAYESMTTVYSSDQGYATCGSSASGPIAWKDNTYIPDYATYQNSSSWMPSYSAMKYADPCIPYAATASTSRGCPYTTSSGMWVTPFTAGSNNPAACLQSAALAVTDIMYALSYIASCEYIKSFALLTAVESTGACFNLGDGLVYMIAAQGLVGIAFFVTTVVGVKGYRRFNSDNDAGNKVKSEDEELYNTHDMNANDDPDDAYLPYTHKTPDVYTEMTGPGVQPNAAPPSMNPASSASRDHDMWV